MKFNGKLIDRKIEECLFFRFSKYILNRFSKNKERNKVIIIIFFLFSFPSLIKKNNKKRTCKYYRSLASKIRELICSTCFFLKI